MQNTYFEGAKEIGKPETMTDDECMSAWAMPIVTPAGKDAEGNELKSVMWLEHFQPSKEDLEAMNQGRGFWVQLQCGSRLIPMAIFTLDENGKSNDAG
jgi:hypothetical protein